MEEELFHKWIFMPTPFTLFNAIIRLCSTFPPPRDLPKYWFICFCYGQSNLGDQDLYLAGLCFFIVFLRSKYFFSTMSSIISESVLPLKMSRLPTSKSKHKRRRVFPSCFTTFQADSRELSRVDSVRVPFPSPPPRRRRRHSAPPPGIGPLQ